MARPAKVDNFTPDEARRFRDGIRDACLWLGIPISDLARPTEMPGHGERPASWVYNALKHNTRALTRDTAVSLWIRLDTRARQVRFQRAGKSNRELYRQYNAWLRELSRCIPLALRTKLAGPIVPVKGQYRALNEAFQQKDAGKVALRLSRLMAPNSASKRARIHAELRRAFGVLYEPATVAFIADLEKRRASRRNN